MRQVMLFIVRRAWLAGMAILLVMVGCGSPRRGEPLSGPLRLEDPGLARGRMAFQQHCHSCHPGGEGGLGPSLNDKPLPGFLVKRQVRWGLGVMPSFDEEQISGEELDHLVQYMSFLRGVE